MSISKITRLAEACRAAGLLERLSAAEIDEAIAEAEKKDAGPRGFILSLPGLTHWFDTEYWWDPTVEASYEKLVRELHAIARSTFQLDNVSVTAEREDLDWGDKLLLRFELNGQEFRQQLTFQGEWLDLHFVTGLNDALASTGVDGRYYFIDTQDQTVLAIFLMEAQRDLVRGELGSNLRGFDDKFDESAW